MLCLDNPDGLTNHPQFGHSHNSGVSPIRKSYKKSFMAWHETLNKRTGRLPFYQSQRYFAAPREALNTDLKMKVVASHFALGKGTKRLNVDVCIVTNLCFPGGNASSTIEEVKYLDRAGYNVKLVHCPRDNNQHNALSMRYFAVRKNIVHWYEVGDIFAKKLIVRNPGTMSSQFFKSLQNRSRSDESYLVFNNSLYRPSGELTFQPDYIKNLIKELNTNKVYLCPIGPMIRSELLQEFLPTEYTYVKEDWTPTFDISEYYLPVKKTFSSPITIGRHGRDGAEKWHENTSDLLLAYPNSKDYKVCILGGANQIKTRLGSLPSNWEVYEFGSKSPLDYLDSLDVFIYLPHSKLVEAFGRTIVEAMIAGIPCILPRRFRDTFEELPLYSDAERIEELLDKLRKNDSARIDYCTIVQELAFNKYSSSKIPDRLGYKSNLANNSTRDIDLYKKLQEYREYFLND